MKHFPFVVAAVVGFPFCAEIFSTHVAGSSFFFYDWRRFLLEVAAVAACGMLARTFGFCLPCLPLPTSLTTLSLCPSVVAHMRRMRLLFQRRTQTHIMPHMPHSRRRSRRSRTRGSAAAAAAASRLGIGIGERQFDSRQPVRAAGNCRIIFMAFEATATWHATLALASQSHLLFRVFPPSSFRKPQKQWARIA